MFFGPMNPNAFMSGKCAGEGGSVHGRLLMAHISDVRWDFDGGTSIGVGLVGGCLVCGFRRGRLAS